MAKQKGWELHYGGGLPQQVMPLNDLIEHVESENCICRPFVDEDGMVIHHAADGREHSEPDCDPTYNEKPIA